MKPIAQRDMQSTGALAEQLDALATLPTGALRKHWAQLYKTQPPMRMSRDLLLLAIGWKVQARAKGGLSTSTRRQLILATSCQGSAKGSNAIRLKPGTRLVREWHGTAHEVQVLEKGFEWQGKPHRSLSQIAREITGARWSGPRFFGLKPKPDNFARLGGSDD